LGRKCRGKLETVAKFFRRICCRKNQAAEAGSQRNGSVPFPVGNGPILLGRNSNRQLVPGRTELIRQTRSNLKNPQLDLRKEGVPENERTLLPEPVENHRNISRL